MNHHIRSTVSRLFAGAAIAVLAVSSQAADYRVGGLTQAAIPASENWAWDGSYITDFRSALENPAYFGPGGIVNRAIVTVDLADTSAASLSAVDMFVATWIADGNVSAAQVESVRSFFLGGGDLFLLQDDSGHDPIGAALGLVTSLSTGSVSNGGAPLYDGPFGVATDVPQLYAVGKLDAAAVAALGGAVAGTNVEGEVTSAYWAPGAFAPGAGALFINADIDMIASTPGLCSAPICGAAYAPLNNNGIFALNTFAHIANPVPEPSTYALMALGLAGLGAYARRRRA